MFYNIFNNVLSVSSTGTSSGAVSSVASRTGNVVLTSNDLTDEATLIKTVGGKNLTNTLTTTQTTFTNDQELTTKKFVIDNVVKSHLNLTDVGIKNHTQIDQIIDDHVIQISKLEQKQIHILNTNFTQTNFDDAEITTQKIIFTNNQELVSKKYVDDIDNNQQLIIDNNAQKSFKFSTNGNPNTILTYNNVVSPTLATDIVTKGYVDGLTSQLQNALRYCGLYDQVNNIPDLTPTGGAFIDGCYFIANGSTPTIRDLGSGSVTIKNGDWLIRQAGFFDILEERKEDIINLQAQITSNDSDITTLQNKTQKLNALGEPVSLLTYVNPPTFANPNEIPNKAYVDNSIAAIGGGVVSSFTSTLRKYVFPNGTRMNATIKLWKTGNIITLEHGDSTVVNSAVGATFVQTTTSIFPIANDPGAPASTTQNANIISVSIGNNAIPNVPFGWTLTPNGLMYLAPSVSTSWATEFHGFRGFTINYVAANTNPLVPIPDEVVPHLTTPVLTSTPNSNFLVTPSSTTGAAGSWVVFDGDVTNRFFYTNSTAYTGGSGVATGLESFQGTNGSWMRIDLDQVYEFDRFRTVGTTVTGDTYKAIGYKIWGSLDGVIWTVIQVGTHTHTQNPANWEPYISLGVQQFKHIVYQATSTAGTNYLVLWDLEFSHT